MKNINICSIRLLLLIAFFVIVPVLANAEDKEDNKAYHLFIGSGLEYLSYSEHEPETGTSSDTSLYNVVTKFEGILSFNHLFIGVKGVLPASTGEEIEEWERFGEIYQTDNLEYAWTRLDGNIGYRFFKWLNPYLGVRWAKSKQERNDFVLDEPVSGKAIETNKAFFVSAGLQGTLKSFSRWQFQYNVDYFFPVSSHTKNSTLQGWEASGVDGYTIGARVAAKYLYSKSLSFDIELSGEKAYWNGSGWVDYPAGSAKWPENETISLISAIGIAWSF